MERVLIDSDIILDFYLKREPFGEHAIEIISLCANNGIQGFITPVIISNVYYLFRQKADRQKVVLELRKLLAIVDVLPMDKASVVSAAYSDFDDFEDALQYFAAIRSNEIDFILTRNLKDYKNSKITVMTPEMYIEARETRDS